MDQEFSHPETEPVLGAGLATLPAFELTADTPSSGERSTAGHHEVRPPLPIALPMSDAVWPAGQTMANTSPQTAKLPSFKLDAAETPLDAPSRCDVPAQVCAPVASEQRISAAACAPKLASASAGVLPAFAVGAAQPALEPPAPWDYPAEVVVAVNSGNALAHAPCDLAPLLESSHAATLPRFELAPAEAPLADTRTAAVIEPAAMCGICVPVPAAQPAVSSVGLHGELQWQWPAPPVAYPAIPSAAALAAKAAPHWEPAFAPTPAAEALEMPLVSAMQLTPYEAQITVQLPAGLDRALAGTTIPLAVPVALRGGDPQVAPVAPVAAFESASSRSEAVLPLHLLRDIDAAAFVPAAPAEVPPIPVESFPRVEFAAVPLSAQFALCYPDFRIAGQAGGATVAKAGPQQPAFAAVAGSASVSQVPLDLLLAAQVSSPEHGLNASTGTTVPQAGLRPLEFFCKRANATPTLNLAWMMPASRLSRPRMQIGAALEVVEHAPAPLPRNKNAAAEVFEIPGARKRAAWLREIAKPLAACFLVGAFLWAVAATVHVASRTAAVNRDVATLIQTEENSPATSDSVAAPRSTAAAPAEQSGVMARIRSAIASRAASQLSETFHEGMAAWGDGRKSTPAGWSRSPEGYVRPATFALFRPSESYRDYRMEFFGLIEQKGMSWAVRATDPKNYYAMKFRVVEPGLRPVVAIEHYPVVGGHKGHRTETPLPELMFHNNTPYRVEVAVKGNRITTSVEGQEVDTWIDDALPKGGVGFFADAGERARVYWVKVAKNEDFLGRICAYISGGDRPTIAGLWPGNGAPSGTPFAPGWPTDHAPVAVATLFAFRGSSQQRRRSEPWSL